MAAARQMHPRRHERRSLARQHRAHPPTSPPDATAEVAGGCARQPGSVAELRGAAADLRCWAGGMPASCPPLQQPASGAARCRQPTSSCRRQNMPAGAVWRTSIGSLPRQRTTGSSGNARRSGILPSSACCACCPAAGAAALPPALEPAPPVSPPASSGRGCTQSALLKRRAAATTAGCVKGEATSKPKCRPAAGGRQAGGGGAGGLSQCCWMASNEGKAVCQAQPEASTPAHPAARCRSASALPCARGCAARPPRPGGV